jgi:phospho-N-acetylmuramoyl-pentapeptide-transferase
VLYWLYRLWAHNLTGDTAVLLRAAAAIMLSFLLVLLFGGKVIRWLMKQKVGDRPEFHNVTLNELTKNKKNTPTMGGIMIVGAVLVSTLLFADMANFYVRMALFCMIYLAALGAVDDWLKLTTARRSPGSRDGLLAWEKLVFQIGLGVVLAIFIYKHNPAENAHLLNWPMIRNYALPAWGFSVLAVIVITGTSNAVNLTDGMDGLACGCMAIMAFAFLALADVTGDRRFAEFLALNQVDGSSELAIVCGAITGASLGFLWYNCNPAQVFMGDTGSLALGGTIGYVAIVIRQEPMLLLVGGIFVVEAMSVMMQVSYFRMTGGKRIFLCSPIHHHFHLKGWSEQQVVVRFWLISPLCADFALATIKFHGSRDESGAGRTIVPRLERAGP